MLSGEYAVLLGEKALALTIDSFMTVTLEESCDFFCIESNHLDPFKFTNSDEIPDRISSEILVKALKKSLKLYNPSPFKMSIKSNLNSNLGFGSSSAVTLAAFYSSFLFSKDRNFHNESIDELDSIELVNKSVELQREHQGKSSGYDVVTQNYGGLVCFASDTYPPMRWADKIDQVFSDFFHIYSGGKGACTKSMILSMTEWLDKGKKQKLCELSRNLTNSFLEFLLNPSKESLQSLIRNNSLHNGFFRDSHVFLHKIYESLSFLDGFNSSWTFKMTGAGGEDSIILIGEVKDLVEANSLLDEIGWNKISLNFINKGVVIKEGEIA